MKHKILEGPCYCISARSRNSGYTDSITGAMTHEAASNWKPTSFDKKGYTYFRVSQYPFKRHKKN